MRRLFDIIASGLMLLVISPVLLLIAIAIPLDSRGPIMFKQTRLGRFGKTFRIWKFRTMFTDSDDKGISPQVTSDPRVTRMGRFLRSSGLDELPQLFNILFGDMTFIGPRPQLPDTMRQFERTHPDLLEKRMRVRPGVTSAWLATPGVTRHYPTVEMLQSDAAYVDKHSSWLDVKIAFRTVWGLIKGKTTTTRRDSTRPSTPAPAPPEQTPPQPPGQEENAR